MKNYIKFYMWLVIAAANAVALSAILATLGLWEALSIIGTSTAFLYAAYRTVVSFPTTKSKENEHDEGV